jgi:hypothetical protein
VKPQVPAAAYAIPIMANAGVKEQKTDGSVGPWEGSKTIFQEYRAKSGLIGFAALGGNPFGIAVWSCLG